MLKSTVHDPKKLKTFYKTFENNLPNYSEVSMEYFNSIQFKQSFFQKHFFLVLFYLNVVIGGGFCLLIVLDDFLCFNIK